MKRPIEEVFAEMLVVKKAWDESMERYHAIEKRARMGKAKLSSSQRGLLREELSKTGFVRLGKRMKRLAEELQQ